MKNKILIAFCILVIVVALGGGYMLFIHGDSGFTFSNNESNNSNSKNKKLTNNPKVDDIKEAISKISTIKEICIVTESNDPNGKLNKQGGYTGALFFEDSNAPAMETKMDLDTFENVEYKDVCEKGTDAGGSIEIYKTSDEAKVRDTYLAAFDSTALSSGRHTVVGSIVIRTSNKLSAAQQKDLEDKIINTLNN